MTTPTEERLFDSFLIVGLTTTTSSGSSPPSSLSSTFSSVDHPSPSSTPAVPENGFEFSAGSAIQAASGLTDVTSAILYRYPSEDQQTTTSSSSLNPKSLCDFCFPDLDSFRSKKTGKKWKIKKEIFSFVLTDTKGGKRWGYCYRCLSPVTSMPVCFCLVSFTPCVGLFSQIVQKLSSLEERTKGNLTMYQPLLEQLYSRPLPPPGQALSLTLPASLSAPPELGKEKKKLKDAFLPDEQMFDPEMEQWTFSRPEDNDWMMDDINVLPLVRFLSPSNIVAVFTSLLVERRMIFVADRLSALSSCVQAAAALLYPFSWQHIFIPVLPQSLLSFACAPMPYVIGVLRSSVAELKKMSDAMEEVVVVDIDNNRFYSPPELLDKRLLPSYLSDPLLHSLEIASKEVRQTLGPLNSYFLRKKEEKKQLKIKRVEEKLERDIRYDLGNAFIGFFIDILGNYKDFILRPRTEAEAAITEGNFDRKGFVEAQPEEVRPLLSLMVQSQLFFMFIEARKKKEAEDKPGNRDGKTWSDLKRREGSDPSLSNPLPAPRRNSKLLGSSGSCIASFSSSSSHSSTSSSPSSSVPSSPISSSPSSPSSSYVAFPLRSSATHTTISSSTASSTFSSSSEAIPNTEQESARASYELRVAQKKLWLQSRFSMYENGEISREDLAKRWKEIEKEEKRMEKEKEKMYKKVKKKSEDQRSSTDQVPQREEIVLLLDQLNQKKMSGEREGDLSRRRLADSEGANTRTDERATDRSLATRSQSSSSDRLERKRAVTALSLSGPRATKSDGIKHDVSALSSSSSPSLPRQQHQQRFNPILRVSAEKRTEASRFDSASSHSSPLASSSSRSIFTPSASTTLISHAATKHSASLSSSSSSSQSIPRSNIIAIPQSPRSASASPSLPTSSTSSSPSPFPFGRPLPPVKLPSSSSGVASLSSSASFTSGVSKPRTPCINTTRGALSPSSPTSFTSSSSRINFTALTSSSVSRSPSPSISSLLSPRTNAGPLSSSSPSATPALASSTSGTRPLPPIPFARSRSHRPTTSSSLFSEPLSSTPPSAIPTPPAPPPPVPPRGLSSIDRLRVQLTRTTKKHDEDPDNIVLSKNKKDKDRETKKDKKKKEKADKADRNVLAQGLTAEETRRIQMLIDKGWKEEKDKVKRGKETSKKEKSEKKAKESSGSKILKKKEDRRAFDNTLDIVSDKPALTRRRSNSDGAKEGLARKAKDLVTAAVAAEGGDKLAKTAARRSVEKVTLHSGHLLKKTGSGKSKNDWQRLFSVLDAHGLSFYEHKGGSEIVLRIELKDINLATFYRNISSLMLFDRENCFELALASGTGSGSAGNKIHLATGSLEDGRAWSEALQKASVPCRLA